MEWVGVGLIVQIVEKRLEWNGVGKYWHGKCKGKVCGEVSHGNLDLTLYDIQP